MDLILIFSITDVSKIPPPSNISTDNTTLQWNHIFQPSGLPPDFVLTTTMNISYHVTVRDREGGEREQTLISHETSLDISHVLDYCRRQEFTVQTVVNDLYHSQNSSYISNPFGEFKKDIVSIEL